MNTSSEFDNFSLFELFRLEAGEQLQTLQQELVLLESDGSTPVRLEALMRSAHSLKGAARIVGLNPIVDLTHAMEDRFVAAQSGVALKRHEVDKLLQATDLLRQLQANNEDSLPLWMSENEELLRQAVATLTEQEAEPAAIDEIPDELETPTLSVESEEPVLLELTALPDEEPEADGFLSKSTDGQKNSARYVRMQAEIFNRLLAASSELLAFSKSLAEQGSAFERSRRLITRSQLMLEEASPEAQQHSVLWRELEQQQAVLWQQLNDFETLLRAQERSAEHLHRTVLSSRLRPFSEVMSGLPRLVRDVSHTLGKNVRLFVQGQKTLADRDILERLESPLSHLVTNALDHGIEEAQQRLASGKPLEASIQLQAKHENGRLIVTVQDDGRGIDTERIRQRIQQRGLASERTAESLSENELLQFLFLPGFSTSETISKVSGRGVGLNVVQTMVQEAGGDVTIESKPGEGTVFRLTLPITRSLLRVLRLQIDGESYAIPLMRLDRVAQLPVTHDEEQRLSVTIDGTTLPAYSLASLLGLSDEPSHEKEHAVIVFSGVAFVADRFQGEAEIPVRPLDDRFGKIPGVSAASLNEGGSLLLILDMDDLLQTARDSSIDDVLQEADGSSAPHILVVDDSHTVREIVRRILVRAGYIVSTAQNGQQAWNLLRMNTYDLLVSDVDMPQMNGIELVKKVRSNPRLSRLPIIILSYKDHDGDRRKGLEAGADYYLTKGDFEKDTFQQIVIDFIGPPTNQDEIEA